MPGIIIITNFTLYGSSIMSLTNGKFLTCIIYINDISLFSEVNLELICLPIWDYIIL